METIMAVIPSIICAICTALMGYVTSRLKLITSHVKANNAATLAMLRDRIAQACRQYQERGSISAYEAYTLQEMYEQYKALGGNGYITAQFERTISLPQEEERD